jgi:UDP-N-acetyl-D-mannosaminuronate dehydrogenase
MPYHVLASVASALNQHKKALNGAHVLVLGVAYKKDIDDLRESPALTVFAKCTIVGIPGMGSAYWSVSRLAECCALE